MSALLIPGIIIRTKSLCSGRKGPGLFQPLRDVRVLLMKGSVISPVTTVIFRIAPSLAMATVITASMLIPMGRQGAVISFAGDFVFFSYLLALGKFFMILAALDTGSSFEGMGANREALYSMLVEPAFLLLMGTFAMFTGYTSFADIFSHLNFGNTFTLIAGIICFYLLIQISMIENSRLPVDDPKTHLELTMVHEVMVLDYSGFDLALVHMATWIKFTMFGALISNSLVPPDWHIAWQILLFLGLQMLFGIMIGLMESFRARNKMMKNPQFILSLTAIAMMAFAMVLIFMNK
ncbi:MAG: NADH-quinone oxidoreductase subunit H [Bacteroidetes bacterium]|nr:NADH-quinone oxidoreductase subunit H [Bacteroidota bacterium]